MRDDEKDKQEKKGNLAGWIGLLTAVAAILGAIGFNQFFPDIVKRYIVSTPQPSSSITPSTPTPTPTQLPDPSPTPIPTPPTPTPTLPTPTSTPSNEREAGGLTFLLKGCRRSGSTVKCDFTVTSKSTINFGMMAWYNAVIDSEGKSYPGSLVDIGGRSANNIGATIEPGINYALVLSFDNVPEQVNTAPLLKLGNGIDYRNVSISD
jgi:hypothetical protein